RGDHARSRRRTEERVLRRGRPSDGDRACTHDGATRRCGRARRARCRARAGARDRQDPVRRPPGRARHPQTFVIPIDFSLLEPLGRLTTRPWASEVTGLQIDSRRIEEGDLFVAVSGGADFTAHALARGAAAELVETIENVARAKAELIDALPPGGVAVVPEEPLLEPYLTRGDIEVRRFRRDVPFATSYTARHQLDNTRAALAVCDVLGVPVPS